MATTPKTSRARRRVGVLAAAALAVGAFAAPGAAHAANCPGADVPLNHATMGQRAQASDALICLANDARANAGLPQLTVDQSLSDFARNKSDTISRGYHNDACGGVAENGFPFSVCVESVEVLVPAPTAQELFNGILTGQGNAIMNPDVTTIGAGVSNGNPTDGPTGAGVTADVLTITPTNAGNNGGGGNAGNNGGGANPPTNGACANADTPVSPNTVNAVEDAVTCLVNNERQQAGLAQLSVNATLHGSASAFSQDMVNRQFEPLAGHADPEGRTFCDRISAAGYPVSECQDTPLGPRTACAYCRENVATGGATAKEWVDGWMNEPPDQGHRWHRETILDGNLKAIGVGVAVGNPREGAGGAGGTVTADFGG